MPWRRIRLWGSLGVCVLVVLGVLAWFTPLFHGVQLTRALSLGVAGDDPVAMLIHVTYLSVLAIVGSWLTIRTIGRRLVRG